MNQTIGTTKDGIFTGQAKSMWLKVTLIRWI